uniref:Uncharacterized protein n=1 Tax=Cannabis sativa TaxID=3483 RepID=A0A803NHL6_CANSA
MWNSSCIAWFIWFIRTKPSKVSPRPNPVPSLVRLELWQIIMRPHRPKLHLFPLAQPRLFFLDSPPMVSSSSMLMCGLLRPGWKSGLWWSYRISGRFGCGQLSAYLLLRGPAATLEAKALLSRRWCIDDTFSSDIETD